MRNRLWAAFGAVLVVVVVFAGCKSEFLSGGILHFDQRRYDQALENFQKAVEAEPQNAEAHLWLGRALAELERDDEAIAELNQAREMDVLQMEMADNTLVSYWSRRYNSALAFAIEADNARNEGNVPGAEEAFDKAIERFRRAVLFCPDSVQNYSNLGRVLYQKGDLDEAMAMFRKSKSMSAGRPDLQRFLFQLFRSFGEQGLDDNTRESYERSLSLLHDAEEIPAASPQDRLEVNYNIGSAYYGLADLSEGAERTGHLEQALEYYQKVLDADPEDGAALENMAYLHSDLARHTEAIEYGRRRLDLEPWEGGSHGPHMLMVRIYHAARGAAAEEEQPRFTMLENGHLLLTQILDLDKSTRVTPEEIRNQRPNSDAIRTLRDRGVPDEIRRFVGAQGAYDTWLYWTEGRIYIFKDGNEQFRTNFGGVSREKMEELISR